MLKKSVFSRALAGKKPRALPGGIQKKQRNQFKSIKGSKYPAEALVKEKRDC